MSSDLKCRWERYPSENDECSGTVDEYYGTDGGLGALCKVHLQKSRHVVWDETSKTPISKSYYDEVYGLSSDFGHEQYNILRDEITSDQSDKMNFWKDWLQTEEGKARMKIYQETCSTNYQLLLSNWRAKQPPIG